jgi:hypothetical protein
LGRVGLLHVVAKRGVAPIGSTKNLLDLSGQSVNNLLDAPFTPVILPVYA